MARGVLGVQLRVVPGPAGGLDLDLAVTTGGLGRDEFAIPPAAFDALDTNHDQALSSDELRRYVVEGKPDAALDVALPIDPTGLGWATLRAEDGGAPAIGTARVLDHDLVDRPRPSCRAAVVGERPAAPA